MTTQKRTSSDKETDLAAVAAVPGRIIAAWAAQDANAFAEVFVPDGSMILPGLYRKGREQIRSFMADGFQGAYRKTRVTGTPLDVTFLGDDTALLVTEGGVLQPGETEVAAERAIRATWVVARQQDSRWQLVAYQNSPAGDG
ncbi:SgcJ/EcaC family oxidoreductase [Amycolatopsis anabasis]|uniref:SgcJ/EcaC family oxidoreductase n=1 Tax=Amycolatopsis anabasis TaxID=1840409 RepID=UPI00131BA29B|nr:SgcJ/EcaC family oxidoreductase [Amycolatopsis anabasis]